jgi:hypothetical protein
VRRRNPGEAQFDGLECRDLLHAGCAGYGYGLSPLHLGLARPVRALRPVHAASLGIATLLEGELNGRTKSLPDNR